MTSCLLMSCSVCSVSFSVILVVKSGSDKDGGKTDESRESE